MLLHVNIFKEIYVYEGICNYKPQKQCDFDIVTVDQPKVELVII